MELKLSDFLQKRKDRSDTSAMMEVYNLSIIYLRLILASCGILNTTHEHLRFMFEIFSLFFH